MSSHYDQATAIPVFTEFGTIQGGDIFLCMASECSFSNAATISLCLEGQTYYALPCSSQALALNHPSELFRPTRQPSLTRLHFRSVQSLLFRLVYLLTMFHGMWDRCYCSDISFVSMNSRVGSKYCNILQTQCRNKQQVMDTAWSLHLLVSTLSPSLLGIICWTSSHSPPTHAVAENPSMCTSVRHKASTSTTPFLLSWRLPVPMEVALLSSDSYTPTQ